MASKQNNESNVFLSALATDGGLVSTKLHQDTIKVGDKDVPVFIAELPDGKFRAAFKQKDGYDRLLLILEAARNEDGTHVFKDAAGILYKVDLDDGSKVPALHNIKVGIAKQLEVLAMKYNGFGEDTSEVDAEGND